MCELSAEGRRVDEVDERPLAPDLHHGQPLPVKAFELRVAVDLDLFEAGLAELRGQGGACPLAEVAAAPAVEDDVQSYG